MSDCGSTLYPPTVYSTPRPLLEERAAFPNDGKRWPPNEQRVPYALTEWPPLDEWTFQLGSVRIGKGEPWCPTVITGMGLPPMGTNDLSLPYAHGSVGFGDFSEPRSVTLEVTGHFQSPQESWDELRRLAGAWQPVTRNEVLQWRMTSGDSLILFGRPRRLEADTSLIYTGIVAVALEFVALDPRFYTGHVHDELVAESAQEATLCFGATQSIPVYPTWGTAVWGVDSWWDLQLPPETGRVCMDEDLCFSEAGDISLVANNNGNVPTPVQITWTGRVDDPKVANSTTGEYWEWNNTSGSGSLVMDSQSRLVTLDGTDRYESVTTGSQWFWLQPGQNRLTFTQDSVLPNVHVRWRDAWL